MIYIRMERQFTKKKKEKKEINKSKQMVVEAILYHFNNYMTFQKRQN